MTKQTCAEIVTRRVTLLASSTAGACFAVALIVACIGWEGSIEWADPVATLGSFLLLFLLQRSQAKDTLSLHVKLDELLAAVQEADNDLISVEEESEEEIRRMHEERQRQPTG